MKNTAFSSAAHTSMGFTLIELMVTVAIAAILASIALPSYRDYVMRGRIPEATGPLANVRVQLEQLFQDERSYKAKGCTDGSVAPKPKDTDYFKFTCTLDVETFTVTATGQGSMSDFEYTINEKNERKTTKVPSTSWGTTPKDCWITQKGGVC